MSSSSSETPPPPPPSSSASVPRWLKSLPLAPEYRPSDTDFADPIAFISRIEREASLFGICKIIPPSSNASSSSSSSLSNLSHSLSPSFTTRHQELGLHRKNPSPKQQVWQSGLSYTLDSFQSKSNLFSKNHLPHPHLPPLLLETLFWNAAASDKPIWIEYANDVPGSGFSPPRKPPRRGTTAAATTTKRRRRTGSGGPLDPGAAALSDTKWNLQVIARAPGSLTRFMPDDIPGVTSPMVYIAMLFSWFAWHVEDHELHSLNFLHVGAPKTWYAVPGDRAGEFEEAVRVKGYGGNVGRLEAFAMLGEKTTLLSPKVVVASGIPCCRLVQNPGEFVVTFPRAYHVGFSHGFNCGEAANFATPQWLKVAREAAVRRAAMNYLPMLSHQQLLYILTMSFVSRVPRALFSGVRSSRLKDRKRVEREILVKKAFLNDMMAENNLLCVLLSKESTSNAVLWEPDLLLSLPTVSQSCSSLSLEAQMSGNNVDDHGRETKDDFAMENLTVSARDVPCQITESIEAQKNACYSYSPTFDEELVEDLDADEDDLPVGLKIDSGTLPCVACGILGYPFMAVVQPSELAHKEFFHVNCEQSHQNLGNSSCSILPSLMPSSDCKFKSEKNSSKLGEQANPDSSREFSPECVGHVPEGRGSMGGTELPNSDVPLPNLLDGKTSKSEHGFCRPRVFCLQHALEIEELLQCKGGANVLIICHSDYIKIKAYTTSVAEEVGMQFNFKDIPLENASPSDLDLINISISDEGHDEYDEDWTSKLGMNLRYSVKPRNQSVSKQEKLSVILCRMFPDNFPPAFSTLKWQSKRSRTPYKVLGVSLSKSYIDVNIEKSESVSNTNTDSTVKLQVYQSRKRKANAMATKYFGHLGEGIPDSIDCRNDSDCRENHLDKQGDEKNSDELFSIPISAAEDLHMYQDSCEPLGVSNLDKIADPCRSETSCLNVNVHVLGRSEMHQEKFSAEEYGTWSNVSTSGKSECQANIVEPESKNIEVQHETGAVVEINSGYEFENTSCSESEIIQHTSASGVPNLEGRLCNSLLSVNQPCDNSEVQPEVLAAGKPDSLVVDHSSQVEGRFSVEEFGTKSKFDTATSEKSESQGNLSRPEAKVPVVQLGARATDANSSQHQGHNSSYSSCSSKKIQNIPISQEPDLDCILDNSLLLVDQPSVPVLSYDNLEMQLEVVNVDTHSKGVNVEHSKLEGETVSNWCRVDKCELQKVGPLAPEENGGNGNSQLNSRSGTTSSQLQLENLPTDERTDVTRGIPVVDNSSMNSADIIPISVLEKAEMKTDDGLKRCHRNMNSVDMITYVRRRYKRKLEEEQVAVARHSCSSFIRGPCEGLRPRSGLIAAPESADGKTMEKKATPAIPKRLGKDKDKKSYACDMEGCKMGFRTRKELQLHLESLCTHKGCRKQFKSHKHLIQHQRVHLDERPLKCPWKMCEKSFKWAWARTEHIRLHTGERPYKCKVAGCGETFRFVSDFSRHRRKTGHSVNSN